MNRDVLIERLTAVARLRARCRRRIAFVRLSTGAVALVLVFTLADGIIGLTPEIRWAVLVMLMAIAMGGIGVLRAGRDISDRHLWDASVVIDRTTADSVDTVRSAWRLSDADAPGCSMLREALIERAIARGVDAIDALGAARVVDGPGLRRSVSRLGFFILGLVVTNLLLPGSASSAIRRILDPGQFHPAWSNISFGIALNPDAIATGDDVAVYAIASSGEGPTWLRVVADDRAEPRILESIQLGESGERPALLHDVHEDVLLYIERGRATSDLFRIAPVARPEMTGAVASVESGDSSRQIALSLAGVNEIRLEGDEVLRLTLSFEQSPEEIAGATDAETVFGEGMVSLTLGGGDDTASEYVLTPIGPGGVEAELSLCLAINRGVSGNDAPGSATESAERASASRSSGDGQASQGDSGVARVPGGSDPEQVEPLSLAEAQAMVIEQITAGAGTPSGGVGRLEPPEEYRALAAQFFRRIVADEDARERRETGGRP